MTKFNMIISVLNGVIFCFSMVGLMFFLPHIKQKFPIIRNDMNKLISSGYIYKDNYSEKPSDAYEIYQSSNKENVVINIVEKEYYKYSMDIKKELLTNLSKAWLEHVKK